MCLKMLNGLEKWGERDCNYSIIEFSGSCMNCGEKAEYFYFFKRLFGIQTKSGRLCKKCYLAWIKRKIKI